MLCDDGFPSYVVGNATKVWKRGSGTWCKRGCASGVAPLHGIFGFFFFSLLGSVLGTPPYGSSVLRRVRGELSKAGYLFRFLGMEGSLETKMVIIFFYATS